MTNESIVVRFDMEVIVVLPDKEISTETGKMTEQARERAILAATMAMRDVAVYIDGDDKEPARVIFDACDSDVIGVYF